MMIIYYSYLIYQPGDENIIVDSTILISAPDYGNIVKGPQLYAPYPVPAAQGTELTVSYYLPGESAVSIRLHDVSGREVVLPYNQHNAPGFGSYSLSTAGLAPGTYLLRMEACGVTRTRIVILE
jgi:hypothetical protein